MESSERSHLATYPTSIKGVLLLDGRVLLVKNSRDEWELPGRRIDATYGCTLVGAFRPAISEEHTEHCLWPVSRLSELKLPVGYRRAIEKWANTI